jgi:uncharacterized protein (TIGR03437 family)
MKNSFAAAAALAVWAALAATPAAAQTPTALPTSLTFSYQVGSTTYPAAGKVTISLAASVAASTPLTVAVASSPPGWLAVTPNTGYAPLSLTVIANPTGLTPNNYPATITVTAGMNSVVLGVTLLVSNPPSILVVTSPSANYAPAAPGATSATLIYTYTTEDPNGVQPGFSELDVASNGNIIPFNVTTANIKATGSGSGSSGATPVWLRVYQSGQLPSLETSGVALSGNEVPIYVALDPATVSGLNPGSYGGTVTIAANSAVNGSATIAVNLVISAGAPQLNANLAIFPSSVIAGPTVNPVITIYGYNFFATSVVTLQQGVNPPITLTSTLLSAEVLQATVNAAYLAAPGVWTLAVTNPAPPDNPGQLPATTTFTVTPANSPAVTAVVNAASYLATATQTGTLPDPVAPGLTSVAPREIVSIFGQNLGPATAMTATPSGTPATYLPELDGIQVSFQIGLGPPVFAPIIMVSSNQINAVVPAEVESVLGTNDTTVTATVWNGGVSTGAFPLTVVAEDPGTFTFGGLGQGQAAILNYNSTTAAYTINSATNAAPRGSTIIIYATGLGELATPVPDGTVPTAAGALADLTARVDINGQPAVVSYAGATPGAVAGLVQINAIVPPTVSTGAAIPITVSIGDATVSRRSQPGVTFAVK